jgi:nicotinamide riboside kinase
MLTMTAHGDLMSPMLKRAVDQNRKRQHQLKRARQLLRAAQLRYWDMYDNGELNRYHRIVKRCRKILNRKP